MNIFANGGVIGEHTYIYKSYKARIDINNARFISIGNNCLITEGCVLLAHDYSYAVVANKYGELLRNQRKTCIGNNVFLGMNTIVLMGASIGDNCIVGAGSVVSGKLEANSVYAGNPAKRICSLEEFYLKLKKNFVQSALIYAEKAFSEDSMGVYLSLFDCQKFYKYLDNTHLNGIDLEKIDQEKISGYHILRWNEIKHK